MGVLHTWVVYDKVSTNGALYHVADMLIGWCPRDNTRIFCAFYIVHKMMGPLL